MLLLLAAARAIVDGVCRRGYSGVKLLSIGDDVVKLSAAEFSPLLDLAARHNFHISSELRAGSGISPMMKANTWICVGVA
jgi:hypothetical protein